MYLSGCLNRSQPSRTHCTACWLHSLWNSNCSDQMSPTNRRQQVGPHTHTHCRSHSVKKRAVPQNSSSAPLPVTSSTSRLLFSQRADIPRIIPQSNHNLSMQNASTFCPTRVVGGSVRRHPDAAHRAHVRQEPPHSTPPKKLIQNPTSPAPSTTC